MPTLAVFQPYLGMSKLRKI